jgi:hypothetical protein
MPESLADRRVSAARSQVGEGDTSHPQLNRPCYCPLDSPKRCSPKDQTHDRYGRRLCCPYDEPAMAAFYRIPLTRWTPSSGRRAAMRKRLEGTLEDIAQRAADTRTFGPEYVASSTTPARLPLTPRTSTAESRSAPDGRPPAAFQG